VAFTLLIVAVVVFQLQILIQNVHHLTGYLTFEKWKSWYNCLSIIRRTHDIATS